MWGASARGVERIGLQGDRAPRASASDYAFLVGRHIDRATLVRAEALGKKWGVLPHTVMIANGWVSARDYYQALAETCGVPFLDDLPLDAVTAPLPLTNPRQCILRGLLKERDRRSAYVIAPDQLSPEAVAGMLRNLRPYRVSLAAPHDVRRAICGHFGRAFADVSVDGLHARDPEQSARSNLAPWQLCFLACGLVALAAAIALQPLAAMRAVSYLLAFISLPLIAFRVFAACDLLSGRQKRGPSPLPRIDDAELPIYTILVPLFREANVLAPLMRALARLDYPAAKLDIKLILEAIDGETIAAAQALDLPGSVEIVVVPELHPRTKPKALNYALPLARGDYLVIYDAEDRPEPDQLRKAVAAFREGPPNLACVQARLTLYNAFDTLAHAPIRHRIWRAVRWHLARARSPRASDPAWRHLKSFPRCGTQMADGLGPVQRHRGCRSRHAPCPQGLSLPRARLDHLRGGADALHVLAPPTDTMDEGLHADLARAYALAAGVVARARTLRLPRLPDHGRGERCCRRWSIPGSMCLRRMISPTALFSRGRRACSDCRSG